MEEIKVNTYISRKEYLKKYNSDVAYALHVSDNIKKGDYARLNTGEIVKVIGIRENKVNKKAIYYGFYEDCWFDSSAVENFSNNIINLIEVGDYVNEEYVIQISKTFGLIFLEGTYYDEVSGEERHKFIKKEDIKSIVTKEQFKSVEYIVEER